MTPTRTTQTPGWRKPTLYASGMALLAFGIAATITADLSVASWDAVHLGVAMRTGVTVGQAVWIVAVLLAGVAAAAGRRPTWRTPAAAFAFGAAIDAHMAWIPTPDTAAGKWLLLIAGAASIGVGLAGYLTASMAATPHDLTLLALADRFGTWQAKAAIDVAATAVGVALGAPIGVALPLLVIVPAVTLRAAEPHARRWLHTAAAAAPSLVTSTPAAKAA